ncbi:CV039 protein, partial [Pachyramphus minor]|nr:CV039 protein [Pachyramphus minor]
QPPRPCEDYWGEWKHCRGLRHAFHHYYAHGELPSCGRWREDYEACRAWERHRAAAAQVPPGLLRHSPAARGCSYGEGYAPVWTLRKRPPPDWYLPLDQDKPN